MAEETVQDLLQKASTELQIGNSDAGVALLNLVLKKEPKNAPAHDLAAQFYLTQGRVDEAVKMAQLAVSQISTAPFVVTYAEALKAQGQLQKASELFGKVLEKEPHNLRALVGLGELYENAGYNRQAVACYKTYLKRQPTNLTVAIKYSNLLTIPELVEGLAAVERAKPVPGSKPKHLLGYYSHAVIYKEWAERARHSLMPYHATSMDELFFKYGAEDRDEYEAIADRVLKDNPSDKWAVTSKASALFSRLKRLEAEPYYKLIAEEKPGGIYDAIVFAPESFKRFEAITDAEMNAAVPPLSEVLSPVFEGEHIIYLSCNYGYFVDFGRFMMMSIDDVAPNLQVHLHIMDATSDDLLEAKDFCLRLKHTKVAITSELSGVTDKGQMAARCYYHAIRFIRLYQHLKHYKKTLWLMDVDALLHRDPTSMFNAQKGSDAAFRVRPGRWEPWNQFNASVMAISPTERGERYLRLIAQYITDFYRRDSLRWGIDQLAMYAVYEHMRDEAVAPQVHILGNREVDYEYFDDGYVWCNSGRDKFIQLKMIKKGIETAKDNARAKYLESYQKYAKMVK